MTLVWRHLYLCRTRPCEPACVRACISRPAWGRTLISPGPTTAKTHLLYTVFLQWAIRNSHAVWLANSNLLFGDIIFKTSTRHGSADYWIEFDCNVFITSVTQLQKYWSNKKVYKNVGLMWNRHRAVSFCNRSMVLVIFTILSSSILYRVPRHMLCIFFHLASLIKRQTCVKMW